MPRQRQLLLLPSPLLLHPHKPLLPLTSLQAPLQRLARKLTRPAQVCMDLMRACDGRACAGLHKPCHVLAPANMHVYGSLSGHRAIALDAGSKETSSEVPNNDSVPPTKKGKRKAAGTTAPRKTRASR